MDSFTGWIQTWRENCRLNVPRRGSASRKALLMSSPAGLNKNKIAEVVVRMNGYRPIYVDSRAIRHREDISTFYDNVVRWFLFFQYI
jgi:hypothetical protein